MFRVPSAAVPAGGHHGHISRCAFEHFIANSIIVVWLATATLCEFPTAVAFVWVSLQEAWRDIQLRLLLLSHPAAPYGSPAA
jgi:hypothetical protein